MRTAKKLYKLVHITARQGKCKAALVYYTSAVKKDALRGRGAAMGSASARRAIAESCFR